MSFSADKQTTDDLNLLGKYKPGSVYTLFNTVRTRGGERLLDELFRSPLSDHQAINARSDIFRYLSANPATFPFTGSEVSLVEDYVGMGGSSSGLVMAVQAGRLRLLETVVNDKRYGVIREGVGATVGFLRDCRDFIRRFDAAKAPDQLAAKAPDQLAAKAPALLAAKAPALLVAKWTAARAILDDRRLAGLPSQQEVGAMSWYRLAALHHLFVSVLQDSLTRLLEILYHFDLYIAVSRVAAEKGFSYAHALPEEDYIVQARDLRHPCLDKAVGNPVLLDRHRNVVFLTGANMAGKSTFMKSFGIALYLAHMGFPVAAKDMVFSVKDGIYTSINVPDNLSMGYSHFYAEVQRVKTIAESVGASQSLLVIFDELFKGTNVKDAYDATLAITAAFAEYRNCVFVISTHIIEVGEVLREKYDNIQFSFLPTVMEGRTPRYTYTLSEGITSDRHGMIIIEQEGILDIITGGGVHH
ncbi:MAG TPA: DNA mismatch repair protein [Puia sp.]|jgi:DNA mismatch repair ATPase MutS